jgi:hypothetical protein
VAAGTISGCSKQRNTQYLQHGLGEWGVEDSAPSLSLGCSTRVPLHAVVWLQWKAPLSAGPCRRWLQAVQVSSAVGRAAAAALVACGVLALPPPYPGICKIRLGTWSEMIFRPLVEPVSSWLHKSESVMQTCNTMTHVTCYRMQCWLKSCMMRHVLL